MSIHAEIVIDHDPTSATHDVMAQAAAQAILETALQGLDALLVAVGVTGVSIGLRTWADVPADGAIRGDAQGDGPTVATAAEPATTCAGTCVMSGCPNQAVPEDVVCDLHGGQP